MANPLRRSLVARDVHFALDASLSNVLEAHVSDIQTEFPRKLVIYIRPYMHLLGLFALAEHLR
jgi:hypothetical protein